MLLPKRYTLEELVDMTDISNRPACQQLLADHSERFRLVAGSASKHHAWPGGYWDHLTEVMNLAVLLYDPLNDARPLAFSLAEALTVLFVHDLEKAWRYGSAAGLAGDPSLEQAGKDNRKQFRLKLLAEYGFCLNRRQANALEYVEGEHHYCPERRQWPLGAFVHACDNLSARLWPEYPRREHDEWPEARRITDHRMCTPAIQTDCPDCGSPPSQHEVRNFDAIWRDGDVHCTVCDAFVRTYDAS